MTTENIYQKCQNMTKTVYVHINTPEQMEDARAEIETIVETFNIRHFEAAYFRVSKDAGEPKHYSFTYDNGDSLTIGVRYDGCTRRIRTGPREYTQLFEYQKVHIEIWGTPTNGYSLEYIYELPKE